MPMYFPDLKSIQKLAYDMQKQIPEKKYKGIIPQNDEELLLARVQLARYIRNVWKDDLFAMEVELAVSEENYEKKMSQGIRNKFFKK